MTYLLLLLSIVLSCARNILSKGISDVKFGTKQFFLIQTCIFACGSIVLISVGGCRFEMPALQTVLYSVIYGILLLGAQYCYTAALQQGDVGICSTVYSLGFIFPTLSGGLFWGENLTLLNILGIAAAISIVFAAGESSGKGAERTGTATYKAPLICAMLSSGGLGIMQKLQQSSNYPEQRHVFVTIAFATAGIASFVFFVLSEGEVQKRVESKAICGCGVGMAFGLSNLLNTLLAGLFDSAVFFPTLNIGGILLSVISGVILFNEKMTGKKLLVIIMGIISVVMIGLR